MKIQASLKTFTSNAIILSTKYLLSKQIPVTFEVTYYLSVAKYQVKLLKLKQLMKHFKHFYLKHDALYINYKII